MTITIIRSVLADHLGFRLFAELALGHHSLPQTYIHRFRLRWPPLQEETSKAHIFKVIDAQSGVRSAFKIWPSDFQLERVLAIMLDDESVVQVQLGSVVGRQKELKGGKRGKKRLESIRV